MKYIIISGLLYSTLLFSGCANNNQLLVQTGQTQTGSSTGVFTSGEAVDLTGVLGNAQNIEWKELIGPVSGNLYYILLGDKGLSGDKIGCDDSLIKVETKLSGGNLGLNLENLYKDLIKGHNKPENATNSLETSKIEVVEVKTSSKMIQISLSGNLNINGACDSPRIKEQLENVVKQFKIPSQIILNGSPLSESFNSKQ